jgi:hypothetical protein
MPTDGGGRRAAERFALESGIKIGPWAETDAETQGLAEGLQRFLPRNLEVVRLAGSGPLVLIIQERRGFLGLGRRMHATYSPLHRSFTLLNADCGEVIKEAVRRLNAE